MCNRGGGDRVVWRAGVKHCVFDHIPPTKLPNHPRGPQTVKHLPPGPFTGEFLRKADIKGLVSLELFGPCATLSMRFSGSLLSLWTALTPRTVTVPGTLLICA